jgi:LysR family transcriptional regulator, transcription activator of glutamate synthase operon
MDVRQLRYFAVAARELHFTRAAAELHIAQPALSQQIAQLERELGVLLFDRTRHRVRLTPAGEALRARTERILTEVERAEDEMHAFAGVVRGRVVVGALASVAAFHLPSVLARFHARYPGVELVVHEDVTEQLAALLRDAKLDMALVHVVDETLPPDLADSHILTETLFSEPLVLIAPRDHELRSRSRVTAAELHAEPFVAFKSGSGLRRVLYRMGVEGHFAPRIVAESGDIGTIRGLVAAGLGISLVPQSLAEADGADIALLPLATPLTRTVLLIWHRDLQRSPAADACLAFVRADTAEHPWR